jgi:hypothetical protein
MMLNVAKVSQYFSHNLKQMNISASRTSTCVSPYPPFQMADVIKFIRIGPVKQGISLTTQMRLR